MARSTTCNTPPGWLTGGRASTSPGWLALKTKHKAVLQAAGADRFSLDRLCLDNDPPLRCELERVRKALGRVADEFA